MKTPDVEPAAMPAALGVFQVGPLHLAFPCERIATVVRGPIELTALPQAPRHLLGACTVNGAPLPVFDLAGLLRPERLAGPLTPVNHLVVLETDAGTFGVQVDAPLGVHASSTGCFSELPPAEDGSAGFFRRLFSPPSPHPVATVIDLQELLLVPGLRTALRSGRSGGQTRTGRSTDAHLLFEAQGVRFAVPLGACRGILRHPDRLASDFHHAVIRGFHRINNVDTPVLDLGSLLGCAGDIRDDASGLLVTGLEGRTCAWRINRPLAILPCLPVAPEPTAGHALHHPEVLRGGYTDSDGQTVFVLDPKPLLALPDVMADLRSNEARDVESAEHGSVLRSYMLFRSGGILAVDLTQVYRIVSLKQGLTLEAAGDESLLGHTHVEKRSVPVVDLPRLLGRPPLQMTGDNPVLVAETDRGLIGFAVEAVDLIHRGRAQPAAYPHFHDAKAFAGNVRAQCQGRDVVAAILDLPALIASKGLLEQVA